MRHVDQRPLQNDSVKTPPLTGQPLDIASPKVGGRFWFQSARWLRKRGHAQTYRPLRFWRRQVRISSFGFYRRLHSRPLNQPTPRRQRFSAPRPAPDWLRDFRGPPALALVPGLGAGPLLVPEPIADLAGITKDGIMLPLRAAARASALSDLLLLPPVLAGRLHLRRHSPTPPLLSSVKCPSRSRRHLACRTGTRNL
jgi:hypothetical protein